MGDVRRTFEAILNPHPTRPERVALVLCDVTERSMALAQEVANAMEAASVAAPTNEESVEGRGQAAADDEVERCLGEEQAFLFTCGRTASSHARCRDSAATWYTQPL